MKLLILLLISVIPFILIAQESDLDVRNSRIIYGDKWPNSKMEGDSPVTTKALTATAESFVGGFNDLLPYALPAINQNGASSCLFMSHTGIAEWWMNRLNPNADISIGGTYDLSERYFMNLSKADIGDELVKNWRTDTILRLNATGRNYTNRQFPFVKGWYKSVDGVREVAIPNEEDATYGPKYNWIVMLDQLKEMPALVMPKFKRDVILKDANRNQWAINVAPKDIVEKVKKALRTRKAPIMVIYNHTAYWHATMIIGYNDNASSENCPFVGGFKKTMDKRSQDLLKEIEETDDQELIAKYRKRIKKYGKLGSKVHNSFIENGGCRQKGVFYVRDSIYSSDEMPLYEYNSTDPDEHLRYNKKVILREYEWLERLSNHVVQIYVD